MLRLFVTSVAIGSVVIGLGGLTCLGCLGWAIWAAIYAPPGARGSPTVVATLAHVSGALASLFTAHARPAVA